MTPNWNQGVKIRVRTNWRKGFGASWTFGGILFSCYLHSTNIIYWVVIGVSCLLQHSIWWIIFYLCLCSWLILLKQRWPLWLVKTACCALFLGRRLLSFETLTLFSLQLNFIAVRNPVFFRSKTFFTRQCFDVKEAANVVSERNKLVGALEVVI